MESSLLNSEAFRQGLDPAYCYIIFERRAGVGDDGAFKEVTDALINMDFGFYDREVLYDKERGRLLLALKFGPGRIDGIMQEFLNAGLPEDITFYAYGSHAAG
jgi:hypothetical protein